MKKLFSILVLAIILATTPTLAQTKLPADPNVRTGVLPNGLTYYIRHNELPKGRAEFHIAQGVGAILEEDNQNGLAHFLEHMAFNGTKNFPGKNLLNYFEMNGVNFGGNINAYTSLDETVYRLSDVPTAREGLMDSALLVLHDWSNYLLLDPQEIDDERGVILEEWRQRADANRRMWSESSKLKYVGSQYAKRDIIGDTAVIKHFNYKELRDYYHKWYGPDLQAIIVIGDFDAEAMEHKLIEMFSSIPARSNRGERPIYTIPDNQQPIVATVKDKEAQQTRITMEFKHQPIPEEMRNSVEGLAFDIMNELISNIISERTSDITAKPDASFIYAYGGYGNMFKATDVFIMSAVAKDGQETKAMQDLMTQLEKIDRYGFTNAELDRAKANLLANYEKQYNERDKINNITYARLYINNFLDQTPVPGIETEYEIVKAILPQIDVNTLNQMVKEQITKENLIISFTAPEKEGIKLPTEEEAIKFWSDVQTLNIEAPVEEQINLTLVEKAPKAGKIKKVTKNASLGTTEWLLSNGAKVVIKPTNFKQDEILFNSVAKGGLSTINNINDLPSGYLAATIVQQNGLGKLSATDLQKALTGKNVSIDGDIDSYEQGLNGSSTIKDFESLLQLIYLTHSAPRKDDEAYAALISAIKSNLTNRESNPNQIFNDSIQMTMSSHNPRTIIFDMNTLAKVDQNTALQIFKEHFSNAADFTFFFTGNINPDDVNTQKLIAKWIGGLKGDKKHIMTAVDNGVRFPKGYVNNTFKREMEIHAANNRIVYTANMPATLDNKVNLSAIYKILEIRYTESIREKEGGSYGVGVYGYITKQPIEQAILLMQFGTDPDKQARLIKIIHKEIEEIVNEGPKADDLVKVKGSMLKDFEEDVDQNSYWMNNILRNYYVNNIDMIKSYQDAVKNITPESIRETLNQVVSQHNIAEIVMMPSK